MLIIFTPRLFNIYFWQTQRGEYNKDIFIKKNNYETGYCTFEKVFLKFKYNPSNFHSVLCS